MYVIDDAEAVIWRRRRRRRRARRLAQRSKACQCNVIAQCQQKHANDAWGVTAIMRVGRYREVPVKEFDSHAVLRTLEAGTQRGLPGPRPPAKRTVTASPNEICRGRLEAKTMGFR